MGPLSVVRAQKPSIPATAPNNCPTELHSTQSPSDNANSVIAFWRRQQGPARSSNTSTSPLISVSPSFTTYFTLSFNFYRNLRALSDTNYASCTFHLDASPILHSLSFASSRHAQCSHYQVHLHLSTRHKHPNRCWPPVRLS